MKRKQFIVGSLRDAQLVASGIQSVGGQDAYKTDYGEIPSQSGMASWQSYVLTDAPTPIVKKAAKMYSVKLIPQYKPGSMRATLSNPKRAKNPPLFGSRSRKLPDGSTMIGLQVYEIRYRHATDGKDYKHVFETDGVMMLGMPDGSIRIESANGLKMWETFNV